MIGSRWGRSCSVTQEVVTGDTPASLPLPSFSTSGLSLAFSFSQLTLSLSLLRAPPVLDHVCFSSYDVTHAEKLWAHRRSKTLISGLKGDQSWTGVCCLIDNLQLFFFRFPSLSSTYSTYVFSPFLSCVASPAKLLPCVYFKCVYGFIFAVWFSMNFYIFTVYYLILSTVFTFPLINVFINTHLLLLSVIVSYQHSLISKEKNTTSVVSLIIYVSSMRVRCGKEHTHAVARKSN